MQQNTPDQNYYQEDEIDLKQLLRPLADRKWFIFSFTGLITALAIYYALSIPSTYKANISFLSPSQSSVLQLNKIKLMSEKSETSETVYHNFLNNVMSSQFQRKVFDENDYLTRLNPNNSPIKNLDSYISGFTKSVTLESSKDKKGEKSNYEKPIIISLEGGDAAIISSFLNDLATIADKQTVNESLNIIQQKIDIRLEEINKQRGLLLLRAKQDRLSIIERIKEEDGQKINEINDQIERLRVKAKQDRLNKMQVLTDRSKIAKSLGIIDNNFKNISNNNETNTQLSIAVGDNIKLPEWYLYGEKALLKEIDILQNRKNDDAYVSEIVNLKSKISAINSNQILKTLESRQDDSPFIAEINELDIESIKLQELMPSSADINAMQINQYAYPTETPIKPKKRLIVAVAFIAGFILSIFLVFIMNAFRKEDDKITA
jgi:LPS O-antigen subunit length determinant protein (WzzB/FepE family)